MSAYGELLRAAIEAAGTSNRALSIQLAARDDATATAESERKSIRRYLSGEEMPSREKAAVLAVLLKDPALALVSDPASRRQVRLAKVEAEVADLSTALKAAKLANQQLKTRLAKLETAVAPLLEAQQETGSTRLERTGA